MSAGRHRCAHLAALERLARNDRPAGSGRPFYDKWPTSLVPFLSRISRRCTPPWWSKWWSELRARRCTALSARVPTSSRRAPAGFRFRPALSHIEMRLRAGESAHLRTTDQAGTVSRQSIKRTAQARRQAHRMPDRCIACRPLCPKTSSAESSQ